MANIKKSTNKTNETVENKNGSHIDNKDVSINLLQNLIISKKRKIKTRDNEYRKQLQEARKLKKVEEIKEEIVNPIIKSDVGRNHTISIAISGNILDDFPSLELKTKVINEIANIAKRFGVDEIVIYDENCDLPETEDDGIKMIDQGACINNLLETETEFYSPILMAFILKYLETPQYMQKTLFPQHPCLSFVNIMDYDEFRTENCDYFEGIVIGENGENEISHKVDIGFGKLVRLKKSQEVDSRVTLKYNNKKDSYTVVDRDQPRMKAGAYWGYRLRLANGISGAINKPIGFRDCCGNNPNDCNYDLIIGTSETGRSVDDYKLKTFKHLLIVFGGKYGIESSMTNDKALDESSTVESLFHSYLNICPSQTTRMICSDEAISIALASLQTQIARNSFVDTVAE